MKNKTFGSSKENTDNITRCNKESFVSMETIAKICDALECGVDDILEFSKD